MRVVLFDLDNTLIDRAAAFREWASRFVQSYGVGGKEQTDWLVAADADGSEHRLALFERACARFELEEDPAELARRYRRDFPRLARPAHGALEAIARLRDGGWRTAIVTNGPEAGQSEKIRAAGLFDAVDCVVIAGAEGIAKPDPRLFRLAVDRCGSSGTTSEGWMVGDDVDTDIGGGIRAGLRTAWIRRDRSWSVTGYHPDIVADDVAEAVDAILSGAM